MIDNYPSRNQNDYFSHAKLPGEVEEEGEQHEHPGRPLVVAQAEGAGGGVPAGRGGGGGAALVAKVLVSQA